MARGKRPVSAAAIRQAFRKAGAELNAKKKKAPGERKVIDLQLKTLKDCERLLEDIQLI
jgi:hypothetical protein